MKEGNTPFQDPVEKKPMDVMQKFVDVFAGRMAQADNQNQAP